MAPVEVPDWSTEDATIASENNDGLDVIVASGSVRVGRCVTFRNQYQTPDSVMACTCRTCFLFLCVSDFEIGEFGDAWAFLQLWGTRWGSGRVFSIEMEETHWVYLGWRIRGILSGIEV